MISTTTLVLLSYIASSLASPAPTLSQRAATLTCPIFSVSDESISFTLLAVGQSDDSFRRPLALGNVAGALVLASTETLNQSLDTNFTLVSNGLYSDPAGYISDAVTPGGLLSFTASKTDTAVPAYCEGFNTSPHGTEFPYTLSASTDFSNFALCTTSGVVSSVDVVVYAPVEGKTVPYDAGTCIPVSVHPVHDCC